MGVPTPRGQNSAEMRVLGFKICLPATGCKQLNHRSLSCSKIISITIAV